MKKCVSLLIMLFVIFIICENKVCLADQGILDFFRDHKVLGYAKLNESVDINGISGESYFLNHNGRIMGEYLIWEHTLNDLITVDWGWTFDCDSDDRPDDPIPSDINLVFAINANGDFFAGAEGDESNILHLIAFRTGSAFSRSNDESLVWSSHWDSKIESSLLYHCMGRVFAEKIAGIGSDDLREFFNDFYTTKTFGLRNGYSKNIIRVASHIFHQQADYSWYEQSLAAYHQIEREHWSPAITRNANMTLSRYLELGYQNPSQSYIVVHGYGDNGNWAKEWLDGELVVQQYDCGVIYRYFKDQFPNQIEMQNWSIWSSISSRFNAAYVADNVTIGDYWEKCNSQLNPINSFDQNPSPIIDIFSPGWTGESPNSSPTADAGDDQTLPAGSNCEAAITLDGDRSTDPDSTSGTNDDIVFFDWYENGELLGSSCTLDVDLTLGEHNITLIVTDSAGETSSDEVIIVVEDKTPPEITDLTVNPDILWPPNHKMVPIDVTITANDNCDDDPTIALESIAMNEGDENDIHVDLDSNISLRAERNGTGNGRIYTITYEATDDAGNIAPASATVTVPHDKGKKK